MGYDEEATAELDREETVEAIASALIRAGCEIDVIGSIRRLAARLAAGDRWDLVFNIAEGFYGSAREAQVPALLEAYEIPCTFSDAMTLAIAQHKAYAKLVVASRGVRTPSYLLIDDASSFDFARFSNLSYPLFVKPACEGTSKGISLASLVVGPDELSERLAALSAPFDGPMLVEEYLPGREVTVGIAGCGDRTRSLGVAEIILHDSADGAIYSYRNKEECEHRVAYVPVEGELADEAAAIAIAAWNALGCRDAGRVDLRQDRDGRLSFIEVNPLSGLHPTHSDLPILCAFSGMSYDKLIATILTEANTRVATSSDR
ncbi:MAG: D-alanine--D-alanine ligase [Spirochaetaceae bacterium]|nr:MAG: D-alanine--D-alanine ligase [Spirochaetaceae bacterium]